MRLFVTYVVWAAAGLLLGAHIGAWAFHKPDSLLSDMDQVAYILVPSIGFMIVFFKLDKLIVAFPVAVALVALVYASALGMNHPILGATIGAVCCYLTAQVEYWYLPFGSQAAAVTAVHPRFGPVPVATAGLTPAQVDRQIRRIREEC